MVFLGQSGVYSLISADISQYNTQHVTFRLLVVLPTLVPPSYNDSTTFTQLRNSLSSTYAQALR